MLPSYFTFVVQRQLLEAGCLELWIARVRIVLRSNKIKLRRQLEVVCTHQAVAGNTSRLRTGDDALRRAARLAYGAAGLASGDRQYAAHGVPVVGERRLVDVGHAFHSEA